MKAELYKLYEKAIPQQNDRRLGTYASFIDGKSSTAMGGLKNKRSLEYRL